MSSNTAEVKEFTFAAISVGIIIGVVMTAANVYLGLYAGMTVSASIPAAVIAMGVFRGILRRNSVLESNLVQTMASAGESLAAGIIFTVPALVLVGAWNNFEFWPTTLMAMSGGLLGVIFMIPLRKALIVDEKTLTYPEGVACAAVLESGSGDSKGLTVILKGLGIGALFKILGTGLSVFRGSVEWATTFGGRTYFMGADASPALLAVGYIVKLEIAMLVFMGGAIGWFVGIPLYGIPAELTETDALSVAWTLWSTKIRYLGVGAMVVGGLWSIFSVRTGISSGLSGLKENYKKGTGFQKREDQNMNLPSMGGVFILTLVIMFGLYNYLIGSLGHSLLTTIIMVAFCFLFVAVSSYIVGLVGSSNNPVSGMTISALLGTAALFLFFGFTGESAILATLGVAAVVCCAACTAGDTSQDLKTGYLVKATPKYQQYAQVIGVLIPALVIAPVLTLLHSAYGIGEGLKAPQATLFASITNAIFGKGNLPYEIIGVGMALGIAVIIIDQVLKAKGSKYRVHIMPMAVGIYLPITLAVPILLGGLIRTMADNKRPESKETDSGVLLSSGLIAGEAIMGVVLAIFFYFGIKLAAPLVGNVPAEILSILALLALGIYLLRLSKRRA